MPIQNRRQFFKNASPLIALPWLRTKGIFTSSPDTILYNANVITVNPKNPEAQAIAILGEKVVAIGENDQILKLANSNQPIIFKPLPEDDPLKRQPDITLAKKVLNWSPQVSRKEGMKRTFNYFQNLSDKKLTKIDHKDFSKHIKQ